jgi:hypothetical protein
MFKNIKKIAIIASAVVLFAILASSCQTNERCAAYGESYKYQREQNY